jgi:hypothetical protein
MPELDDKLTRGRGGEKFVTKREEKSERKNRCRITQGLRAGLERAPTLHLRSNSSGGRLSERCKTTGILCVEQEFVVVD